MQKNDNFYTAGHTENKIKSSFIEKPVGGNAKLPWKGGREKIKDREIENELEGKIKKNGGTDR